MDSLTHTVLGACMGEAIAGKQMGKRAMLVGALAHNLPDVDVVFNFFTTQATSLLTHRGITHSILFNLIFTLMLSWMFSRYTRNKEMHFKRWMLLIGSGLLTHIIIDAFTAYGTGWFEPFDHARVSFNSLFIIDPFLLLPMLIGAVALLLFKIKSQNRNKWAKIVLIISGLYLATCITNKLLVNNKVKHDLAEQNIDYDEFMATPTPLNNLLWYIIARKNEHCYIGYYSVFDKKAPIRYQLINRNDSVLLSYKNSDEIKKLPR